MKKHQVLFMTTVFLLVGVGTATAAAGPGQASEQSAESAVESGEAADYLAQLYEFKVKVAGEEMQIPVSYRELADRGWALAASPYGETVSDKQSVGNFDLVFPYFAKGNVVMSARMINGENRTRYLMDLEVSEVTFALSFMTGTVPDIVLPGNIIMGKSTEADVKAAYGEPTFSYVGDASRYGVLTYSLGEDQSVSFSHDNDTDKVIKSITMTNEMELYRKGMEYISTIQPSAEASAYIAPTDLGTEIASGIYEFEGDVYRFPAPLTAFLDKGWTIESRALFAYFLNPGEEIGVSMERNGVSKYVTVRNNGTERTSIHNCFTPGAFSESILPNRIHMGSSRSDVLKALEGTDFTYDEENSLYTVKNTERKLQVEIWVYDYDDKVMNLMISPSDD